MKKIQRPKNKILKKLHFLIFGKLMLDIARTNKKNMKKEREKREELNLKMKNMMIKCSKILPPKPKKDYNKKEDNFYYLNDNGNSRNSENEDTGSYAYQTGQLF
jgi:hypothetical protein